ncbi:GATA transcription factor 12-like [Salvia hispanica]|uniref:GATA transcription factor 12-like n=1 Tax=Salvia hispanica TaxID=49212 RepID=UPI002009537B|nr:GATA transcription factor 12-like [Salvia hispanica]
METPEFFQTDYYTSQFTAENAKTTDHFIIDDLLDFPNDDCIDADNSSTPLDNSCNSTFSATTGEQPYFQAADVISNELAVPYDELAELEWVSSFVDESFSSDDLQKLHLIQGLKARTNEAPQAQHYNFQPNPAQTGPTLLSDMSVPGKARSKRSRAAPGSWTSRLLMVSPTPEEAPPAMSSSSESDMAGGKKPEAARKKEAAPGPGRKCLHCATDKTPQWRTGPMGPKTLCNACGVRYKSGRLVPEYRPAASPTFTLTKHSNSHRKVMELRRQKEAVRAQQFHHQISVNFDGADDYLIHQHIGPDFRQLI